MNLLNLITVVNRLALTHGSRREGSLVPFVKVVTELEIEKVLKSDLTLNPSPASSYLYTFEKLFN